MPLPVIIATHDFPQYSVDILGPEAGFIKIQSQSGIPVLPSVVIPKATFADIAEHAQLSAKLAGHHQPHSAVWWQQFFQHLPLDKALTKTLTQQLIHSFGRTFVTLTLTAADNKVGGSALTPITHHNIHGETNILQSIFQAWAELCAQASPQKPALVLPRAFLQVSPPARASGWAYTWFPQQLKKNQILLFAQWGVINQQLNQKSLAKTNELDQMLVDLDTETVHVLTTTHKTTLYQPKLDGYSQQKIATTKSSKLSLSPTQALKIANLVWRVKRSLLHPVCVEWILTNDQACLTSCTAIDQPHHSFNFQPTKPTLQLQPPRLSSHYKFNQPTTTTGQVVLPGILERSVRVITHPHQLRAIQANEVAVVTAVTSDLIMQLKHLAGIISEAPFLNTTLHQALKGYGIPTITNVGHATQFFRTGQRVRIHALQPGTMATVTIL